MAEYAMNEFNLRDGVVDRVGKTHPLIELQIANGPLL